jgi:transposase-like protein
MPKRKYKAPGKSNRKGIGVMELLEMFPDEEAATKWFENQRWPDGRHCPHCGSTRITEAKHKMPYHCKDCRKYFSVRTGTVMRSSGTPLRKWVVAMYLMTTNLKGVSSMKLHRDLGIAQSTAWTLAQKIRQGWIRDEKLGGAVEVDESYFGGKYHNMHKSKKPCMVGAGAQDKTPVVAIKERESKKIKAKVTKPVSSITLQRMIQESVEEGSTVYTDQNRGYVGLKRQNYTHEAVNHGVGEYVREQAHTNGVESFWAALKRGYYGTYHSMSEKHLDRYVTEFSGRHNTREMDTIDQMAFLAKGMVGKNLPYKELVS